jgi:hypothetical protein
VGLRGVAGGGTSRIGSSLSCDNRSTSRGLSVSNDIQRDLQLVRRST